MAKYVTQGTIQLVQEEGKPIAIKITPTKEYLVSREKEGEEEGVDCLRAR